MKRLLMILLSALFLVALAACASDAEGNEGKGSEVNVNMTSFAFQADKNPIPAGDVTFHVKNSAGGDEHEMVLIKTDLTGDQLPKDESGLVDEEKLESQGEVEVEPNGTEDLSVNLPAGHYVLLCNEPGHYVNGMYADVNVE